VAVTDQFAGAEQDIDQQKASALAAVAQFGRRGLEESAIQAKRSADSASTVDTAVNTAAGTSLGGLRVDSRGMAELGALTQPSQAAYAQDASQRTDFLGAEQGAAAAVNSNYFDQTRQAVPAMRSNAQAVAEQYRRAYEDRQASVAAQAALDAQLRQQAALQNQAIVQQMEQARIEAERRDREARLLLLLGRPVLSPFYSPGAGQVNGFLPGSRRVPIS